MVKRKAVYEITVTEDEQPSFRAMGSEGDIATFARTLDAVDFIHKTDVLYRITYGDFMYEATSGEFGPAHIAEAWRKYNLFKDREWGA